VPAQNVAVPHSEFLERCVRHEQVILGLPQIDVRLQKLLAELIMMRLFDEFQEAISGVALRLACGTPYANGTLPTLLTTPAKSTAGARSLFERYGRTRPTYPRWSRTMYINETTKHVLDTADPFTIACTANSLVISEMQAIRNRIAHKNGSARAAFATVVQRHYGAKLNNISPGLMLLSPRFSPMLLERYVASCRVIAKACAGA
jgi:hypothetical protein